MEKRKTNLTVEDFEDKKYGEGKRYTRFKTSEGWISSFDKPTIEKLKESEGSCVCVEIATDNNDKEKITKFLGDASDDDEAEEVITGKDAERVENSPRKSVKGSAYEKDPVGLAVEVFTAVVESKAYSNVGEAMTGSISLVKQAQEAFK